MMSSTADSAGAMLETCIRLLTVSWLTRALLVVALMNLGVMGVVDAADGEDFGASGCPSSLLILLLEYDDEILGADDRSDALSRAADISAQIERCLEEDSEETARSLCTLEALLGDGGVGPAESPSEPGASSLSDALITGRGSCAALVGLSLALTADSGDPFTAVVLRDHVLLSRDSSPSLLFETLKEGRVVAGSELDKHKPFPPGGPIRVSAEGYVPYYLDNLGARLAEAGDTDRATVAFEQALEVGPGVARVHYNIGTFLLAQDRDKEALQHLNTAIRLGWKDADALVNRGVARWKLGKTKAARRDFTKALELDPSNREATVNLHRLKGNVSPVVDE